MSETVFDMILLEFLKRDFPESEDTTDIHFEHVELKEIFTFQNNHLPSLASENLSDHYSGSYFHESDLQLPNLDKILEDLISSFTELLPLILLPEQPIAIVNC